MTDWRREPVVHFLLLGAALSAASHLLARSDAGTPAGGPAAERRIVVAERDVERLRSAWENRWQRPPTDEELERLIDGFVREEILLETAKELDLGDSDTVVRRRLVEQMELMVASTVESADPSASELRQLFDADPSRYALPATRSFTHIFFSPELRDDDAWRDAEAILRELGEMSPAPGRAPELGDRFPLQYDYPRRSRSEVARHMGEDFADRLFAIQGEGWYGPLRSGYGVHLVRVEARTDSEPRGFEAVRDLIREDLIQERRERAAEDYYAKLKSKFQVVRGEDV